MPQIRPQPGIIGQIQGFQGQGGSFQGAGGFQAGGFNAVGGNFGQSGGTGGNFGIQGAAGQGGKFGFGGFNGLETPLLCRLGRGLEAHPATDRLRPRATAGSFHWPQLNVDSIRPRQEGRAGARDGAATTRVVAQRPRVGGAPAGGGGLDLG